MHGRPIWPWRLNTPLEHTRAGNTRVRSFTVSRIAHAWAYGPKYRTPFLRGPRYTRSCGYSSFSVTASTG